MRVNVRPVYAVVALAILAVMAIVGAVSLLLWDLRGRELEHSRRETISLTQMFMAQTQQSFESTDLVLQGLQERLQTSFGNQGAGQCAHSFAAGLQNIWWTLHPFTVRS